MLGIQKLGLSFGVKKILEDVTFLIESGSLCVIVGQNGSGKSSLLHCLSGWNSPTKGEVLLDGRAIKSYAANERASLLSFLPQRPKLSESIPIIDVVAAARYRFSESPSQSRHQAKVLLQKNRLQDLMYRDWHTLSGGEAQRIALVCLQTQDAKIWLLDEPANHLDPAVQGEIYQNLIQEWETGRTVVLVTHNINLVFGSVPLNQYSNVRVIGLHNQGIYFDCKLSDEKLRSHISSLYKVQVEQVKAFGRNHFVFGDPQ